MTEKEKHPYLDKYPLAKSYKYLVIGTIPPSKELRSEMVGKSGRNCKIDYFYGNVATFWNILNEIYNDYTFDSVENIQKWQEDYSIGITDTIRQCRRKDPCSSKDNDLILELHDFNHSLKSYILKNNENIKKLIFTSGENRNNALSNFKIIMGEKYDEVSKKVVNNLPSPSGDSNRSYFNYSEQTLGLKNDLYDYLIEMNNLDDIDFVKRQFEAKSNPSTDILKKRIPKNLLKKFKVYKYRQIFPVDKCDK